MRDEGMGMPAAVVLWSPWADITETGDTSVTLKEAEPHYLYERVLGPSADAYADPKDQKNPYAVEQIVRRGLHEPEQPPPNSQRQGGTRTIRLETKPGLKSLFRSGGQN